MFVRGHLFAISLSWLKCWKPAKFAWNLRNYHTSSSSSSLSSSLSSSSLTSSLSSSSSSSSLSSPSSTSSSSSSSSLPLQNAHDFLVIVRLSINYSNVSRKAIVPFEACTIMYSTVNSYDIHIPANSHALGGLRVENFDLTPAHTQLRDNFSRLIEKCELLPSCLTQFPKICQLKRM